APCLISVLIWSRVLRPLRDLAAQHRESLQILLALRGRERAREADTIDKRQVQDSKHRQLRQVLPSERRRKEIHGRGQDEEPAEQRIRANSRKPQGEPRGHMLPARLLGLVKHL